MPLTSHQGATFDGLLVHGPNPTRGTVVLEGYTYTVMPLGDLPRPRLQRFIYHEPFMSGEIGFGYFEKYDLENIVRFVPQKDPQRTIGVYGASRVGVTALQHAAMREGSGDVSFYLIDAAFADLGDASSSELKLCRIRESRPLQGSPVATEQQ